METIWLKATVVTRATEEDFESPYSTLNEVVGGTQDEKAEAARALLERAIHGAITPGDSEGELVTVEVIASPLTEDATPPALAA